MEDIKLEDPPIALVSLVIILFIGIVAIALMFVFGIHLALLTLLLGLGAIAIPLIIGIILSFVGLWYIAYSFLKSCVSKNDRAKPRCGNFTLKRIKKS
ncbi:hypothetical protein KKF81_07470 [Candidatus Micrarchaeota archaeon]|nr:hypothetical protein [Candidatus Micrarchaeota archaeon]MBU1166769.1 hypothetical protein [Candidatus Micrarchaeota archaeon]MBU1887233.1 hypothetical protein [Candidatus Micrarchaeota archaeon]